MNPLFQNQPMGPQGDFSVQSNQVVNSQTAQPYMNMPMTQGPTQGIVPMPQQVPQESNMPIFEGSPAPEAQAQQAGIQLTPPNQTPPPMVQVPKNLIQPPKQQQNKIMQQHEQNRQLSDDLTKAVQSPEGQAFQKQIPGVDWNSVYESLNQSKEQQANAPVPVNYVEEYGTANAVQTAFKGGNYTDMAASLIGKSEGKDHAVLSEVFKKQLGENIDPRQTPWCAAYASSVLAMGGVQVKNPLVADSLSTLGTAVKQADATRGDVALFNWHGEKTPHHVGFIDHFSEDGKRVWVVGGNQSDGVSMQNYPTSQLTGIRRPPSPKELQAHAENPTGIANAHPQLGATMNSIAQIESGGEKNPYNTIGKATSSGDHAYGFSQIMGSNIPSWTKEAGLGRMTPKQYLASPEAQRKTTAYHLNKILKQGYSPQDAASIWFTGRPVNKVSDNVKDSYGTTNDQYQKRFNENMQSQTPRGTTSPSQMPEDNRNLDQLTSSPGQVNSLFSRGS